MDTVENMNQENN